MEKTNPIFLDLLLPVAVPNLYTYHYFPKNDSDTILPGVRVCVQFGKRKIYTAIVIKVHNSPPKDYSTKEILTILDEKPTIKGWQPDFWNWVADYYMCCPGEVFNAALPGGLKPEGETQIYLADLPEGGIELSSSEENLVRIIENNPGISIEKLKSMPGNHNLLKNLKNLQDRQIINFEDQLVETYKAKIVDCVSLHINLRDDKVLNELLNHLEQRAPRQLDALMVYIQKARDNSGAFSEIEKSVLTSYTKVMSTAVKALIDKNVFQITQKESSRLDFENSSNQSAMPLSEKQNKAMELVRQLWKEKEVVLLHGVTSSGKTEIYIHLIQEVIKKGKQVLYLLPEIALTAQIIGRLRRVFGEKVGIYHSKFSDAERVEVWNKLISKDQETEKKLNVILGVRSSVFLPFDNLGLIIVDEEHENTYKQFDPAPRYHARDSAIYLAAMHKAKVLLGSATPSLESYFNAKNGKYGLVELFDRHLDIQMPDIQISNIAEARKRKQMSSNFSPLLISEIQRALNNNEQVILFQNRRGFSSFLECSECGWVPVCKQCDVSLTYHKGINRLVCHYCGYNQSTNTQCKACGSNSMLTRGFGTEMVEDDIDLLFPGVRVARMDLDTTRRKKAYEELINRFASGQVDVLIGTQMVSKGLDFDNVSVVGILSADNMLNFPDFRAHERAFQLMAQVSGRAGRKKKRGIVVIQTTSPKHEIVLQVVRNDYALFFNNQLEERKKFNYPPYYRLINLTIKHKQRDLAHKAAITLATELRRDFGAFVLGPEPPVIGRIQNWYLENILIKITKNQNLRSKKILILNKVQEIKAIPGNSTIQVNIDVDPY